MKRVLIVAVAVAGIACGDVTYPKQCWQEESLEVSARFGTPPSFDWKPTCGITNVRVYQFPDLGGEPTKLVWAIAVPDSEPLASPIRYGDAPKRATVYHAAEPILAGKTYRVVIESILEGDIGLGSAFKSFPPYVQQ
jgi:hypothetical protein